MINELNWNWNEDRTYKWKCHKCSFSCKFKNQLKEHLTWSHAY